MPVRPRRTLRCVLARGRWLLLAASAMAAPLSAEALRAVPQLAEAEQLIVVTTDGWNANTGTLRTFVRDGRDWKATAAAFDVAVGRNGGAWGEGVHPAQAQGPQKREGDGRSPAGVFAIGDAFGYAAHADTALNYRPMQASSYCMDVPESPLYNRIVDAAEVGAEAVKGSSEPMRLDLKNSGDRRYREGFVIKHNAKAVPGRGSCIFAHLWRKPGEATAGCTAMEPADMQRLLRWLDPQRRPLFVLLPKTEYARLQRTWSLPALAEAGR